MQRNATKWRWRMYRIDPHQDLLVSDQTLKPLCVWVNTENHKQFYPQLNCGVLTLVFVAIIIRNDENAVQSAHVSKFASQSWKYNTFMLPLTHTNASRLLITFQLLRPCFLLHKSLTNLFLWCFYRVKSSTFILSTAPTTRGKKTFPLSMNVRDAASAVQLHSSWSHLHVASSQRLT